MELHVQHAGDRGVLTGTTPTPRTMRSRSAMAAVQPARSPHVLCSVRTTSVSIVVSRLRAEYGWTRWGTNGAFSPWGNVEFEIGNMTICASRDC